MNEREKESPPVEAVEEVAPAEDRAGETAGPGEAGGTDDAAHGDDIPAHHQDALGRLGHRLADDTTLEGLNMVVYPIQHGKDGIHQPVNDLIEKIT